MIMNIYVYILICIIIIILFHVLILTYKNRVINFDSKWIIGTSATVVSFIINYYITSYLFKDWCQSNLLFVETIIEVLIILITREIILSMVYREILFSYKWLATSGIILLIQLLYVYLVNPIINLCLNNHKILVTSTNIVIQMIVIKYSLLFFELELN